MNILMIVTDLGRMRAFRITRDDIDPTTSPEFNDLADEDLENRHSRVSDRVTDQAGRFPAAVGRMSIGERHGEDLEARNRQLADIARCIDKAANDDDAEVYLAAPPAILKPLLKTIAKGVRQRIRKCLALDLVKSPKLDLLAKFGIA